MQGTGRVGFQVPSFATKLPLRDDNPATRAAPGQDPTPKGGDPPPLQTPKWLYGTMVLWAPEIFLQQV